MIKIEDLQLSNIVFTKHARKRWRSRDLGTMPINSFFKKAMRDYKNSHNSDSIISLVGDEKRLQAKFYNKYIFPICQPKPKSKIYVVTCYEKGKVGM